MVEFQDSAEEAAFRAEVRSFIEANAPKREVNPGADRRSADPEVRAGFERWRDALVEKGWIAPHWPKEYGGAGLSVKEQFILNEELAEAGATNVGGFGVMMLGPTLIVHGSKEQQEEQLPRILRGEVHWAQGWSEPGSGSDLASLQTRAARDGDEYVINGQKIWTSGAQYADAIYMLTRTDPDAPKHRGISFFMLDMQTPGITVRPLAQMSGASGFNEVFFEDVRVPAKNMVGDENRGWYVGMTLTDYERSGIGTSVGVQRGLREIIDGAKQVPEGVSMLGRNNQLSVAFADRWTEAEVAKLFSYRVVTMQAHNLVPGYEASTAKLFTSELNQRITLTTLRLYGLYGNLMDPNREEAGRGTVARDYLASVSSTIAGGTSEIQRNIIATRGLGLPRG
ncbi:MAG: acyl-CoA dehydrogenase family protein [Dehalococcoidia bacterium]